MIEELVENILFKLKITFKGYVLIKQLKINCFSGL